MTTNERLAKLAQDAYGYFKSYAKLGEFLGVSRQQAHRICAGQSEPTGSQVVKLQDLLRKVAVVLVSCGVVSAPQDGAAAVNKTSVGLGDVAGPQQSQIMNCQPIGTG